MTSPNRSPPSSGSTPFIPRSDFLIVTRAGTKSLHEQWIGTAGEDMNFDILVVAYEDNVPIVKHNKVFQILGFGPKVEGYGNLLRDHGDFIRKYRAVAFFDDDIVADAATLSRCFEIGEELGLQIWQPSLSHISHFTYAGMLQNPRYAWRYVNFIEMMCPFFSREKLAQIGFLYDRGYESGIDLIWCNMGRRNPRSFAILDCCSVTHVRPVGVEKEKNGFSDARRYEDDIDQILEEFDLPWLSCVPYACVTRDGKVVTSRWKMFFQAIPLLASVVMASGSIGRVRAVLVHWKHLLTRPARNYQIEPNVMRRSCAGALRLPT